MKGVSDVIAVVMILMITVALAALAYVWFTGIFGSVTNTTQGAVGVAGTQIATKFNIESAKNTSSTVVSFVIRNTGTTNIDLAKLAVYLDGVLGTYTSTGTLLPGSVSSTLTATFPAWGAACPKQLKVTGETGFEDLQSVTCP